jgi:hypothetical protein
MGLVLRWKPAYNNLYNVATETPDHECTHWKGRFGAPEHMVRASAAVSGTRPATFLKPRGDGEQREIAIEQL